MNNRSAKPAAYGPYRKRFPITLYPVLEPLHFVLLGLIYAYILFLAAQSVRGITWENLESVTLYVLEYEGPMLLRHKVVYWMAAQPWAGIVLGVATGFLGVRVESRYRARRLDIIAERSIRKARTLVTGLRNPDGWSLFGLWVAVIAATGAIAWILGVSPLGAAAGLALARAFAFPTRKQLYRVAEAKYRAAVQLGEVPANALTPGFTQLLGISLLFAAVVGFLGFVVVDSWPLPWQNGPRSYSSLEILGQAINRTQGAALEDQIAKDADNRDLRIQLVWFYGQNRFHVDDRERPDFQAAYERHYLWMVGHEPLLTPPWHLRAEDGTAYEEAKAIWLSHIEERANDPGILYKAAEFLDNDAPETAEKLLRQGMAIAPDAFNWERRIEDVVHYREHGEWPNRGNYAKPLERSF